MDRDQVISVLGDFVQFQTPIGPGDNLPAKCPFHSGGQEKNPSFYVYVGPTNFNKSTGSAFCHKCVKGWSLRSLLKDLNRGYTEIHETLTKLGSVSGFQKLQTPHQRTLDLSNPVLPEWLLATYDYCPKDLLRSGFTKKVLKDFDIGFDLLHGRITFPLRDHLGRLVGISGRTVLGHPIRYKIYKSEINQPRYNLVKQRLLWNLHDVRVRADQQTLQSPIMLCEGFKAVMWLKQQGYPNAVCSLGTHTSEEQILLLSYLTDSLLVFFDNDRAGIWATHKVIAKLTKYFSLELAKYPSAEKSDSPDDLSKEEIDHAVINSLSVTEWRSRYAKILREIRRDRSDR